MKISREYDFFQAERDQLLSGEIGEKLKTVSENLSKTQNEMNQIIELNQQKEKRLKSNSKSSKRNKF